MQVVNIKVTENKLVVNDVLKQILKYMPDDSIKLLPDIPTSTLAFSLTNCNSSFANSIRRVLIEELPVVCLSLEEKALDTNDDFILSDVFIKNINLLPINQELSKDQTDTLSISLAITNDTNDIIDVKASDIKIKKHDISYLIPNANIIIIRLRPGKFINVSSFTIESGYGKHNAAKFSLLNNVTYAITDVVPYDQFTDTGVRSINADCKAFDISFTTASNITLQTVVKLLAAELTQQLTRCREKIATYATDNSSYYFANGLEVTTVGEVRVYKFFNEYITLNYMIAHKCYLLDKNIVYCSRSVNRYDNEIAIIKMIHPNCNKLLLAAIDELLSDVELVRSKLLAKV